MNLKLSGNSLPSYKRMIVIDEIALQLRARQNRVGDGSQQGGAGPRSGVALSEICWAELG